MKTNKKKLGAILGAGVIGLVGYGVYASSLTVNDSSANAVGSGTVASGCDATVTTTAGNITWDDAVGDYVISAVTVAGVDDTACNGKTITVTAVNNGGVALADGTDTVATSTTSYPITLDTPVVAEDLTKFGVLIR